MVASPAVAMLFAAMTVLACAETAAAKATKPRHLATAHPSNGRAAQRTKLPVSHAPREDEKAWMERASAPTSGGPGGGM